MLDMKTILIIHGIGGHAGIHWQQWLHDELIKQGYKVLMPEMPSPDKPDREAWLAKIEAILKEEDLKNLTIIGHSLGATTAFDYVEQIDEKIDGLVSVSGFAEDYGAELNGYFLKQKHIDFEKVRNNLSWASVLYGDDDPYVTQDALEYVADGLNVEPIIIPGGGHLNTEKGYVELPQLMKILEQR